MWHACSTILMTKQLALVAAPERDGGALRYGAWLSLDAVEKFLVGAK
jgi:hypothetical protein